MCCGAFVDNIHLFVWPWALALWSCFLPLNWNTVVHLPIEISKNYCQEKWIKLNVGHFISLLFSIFTRSAYINEIKWLILKQLLKWVSVLYRLLYTTSLFTHLCQSKQILKCSVKHGLSWFIFWSATGRVYVLLSFDKCPLMCMSVKHSATPRSCLFLWFIGSEINI